MSIEDRIWLVAKLIDPKATAVVENGEPKVDLEGDPKTESINAAAWLEWSYLESEVRHRILPAAKRIVDAMNPA